MRAILTIAFLVFLVLFGTYLTVELVPADVLGGADRARTITTRIASVSYQAWEFGRPLLQLVAILLIFEWLFRRLGLNLDLQRVALNWDVRALLAVLVVGSFAVAALASAPGMGVLQDVALVVIGFYFGELKRKDDESDTLTAKEQPSPASE